MPTIEDYLANNPIEVIDQNQWTDRDPEVAMQFRSRPVVYTPLIEWVDRSRQTGAETSVFTELLEGDVNNDELTMTQQWVPEPFGVDSRSRSLGTARYGKLIAVEPVFSLN